MNKFASLLPQTVLQRKVEEWLTEDIPSFDGGKQTPFDMFACLILGLIAVGAFVVGDAPQTAKLYCKARGVMAGRPFVDAIFAHLGCTVDWRAEVFRFLFVLCFALTDVCRKALY